MLATRDAYQMVYEALSEMREAFHRYGRIDDSNAKLDEVAKLFAAYLAHRRERVGRFPEPDAPDILVALTRAFAETCELAEYKTNEGVSIFGSHPRLVLRQGDVPLARELVHVVRRAVDAAFAVKGRAQIFDVLNEAFGHFVRDNFRSNIEDAQYMTPPEVVDFMVDLAIHEVQRQAPPGRMRRMTVMDPSCGVGSFLTAFSVRAARNPNLKGIRTHVIGQDKIERMVRLTSLNMALHEVGAHDVTIGNSLEAGSPLDGYNGKVDVIITNPPFGARFSLADVKARFGANTAFFGNMRGVVGRVDSELLFIDRALTLLKPGGLLFVVVPDAVISAKGVPALFRQWLQRQTTLSGVIELPPVTFAQAGTRTRTSVLYLQKLEGKQSIKRPPNVFMATVEDLGFEVSSRKGVQIKSQSGTNQLSEVGRLFREANLEAPLDAPTVLSHDPSVGLIPQGMAAENGWTPSHFSATRLEMLRSLRGRGSAELFKLGDLVEFVADTRRAEKYRSGVKYISVLHVIGEGTLDFKGISSYAPKTPGVPVRTGELIFSRLNPHITRAVVVPNLGETMLCSSEFEIMRVRERVDAYAVCYLIHSQMFVKQVSDLTSGTSSSHSRIRSEQLAEIVVALPARGSAQRERFDETVAAYRTECERLTKASAALAALRSAEAETLGAS
ncbi:N-6 DNA methylase [Corallococcus exiguus]|uniref:N-6 DNA methylase n=1 Tax=Corallococcus exiguus TaxID=83462 RepID=UPI00156187AE|nr:N-6 DNA methylase [Corallococcus exiguus]NRD50856.1 N-6 DNA methylase [Corallococcus exiguus]